jgi:hypothetical protein
MALRKPMKSAHTTTVATCVVFIMRGSVIFTDGIMSWTAGIQRAPSSGYAARGSHQPVRKPT